MSLARRALALALTLLLAVLVTMEAGLWIRTEVHRGPFLGETGNPTVFFTVGRGWLNRCCVGARTDVPLEPERSRLRLWFGDVEYPHPHSGHDVIRTGAPGTFSHWINELRLTLPAGQPDDASAVVRIAYPVQILDRGASLALIGVTALALLLVLGRALYPRALLATVRRNRRPVSALLAAIFAATLALEGGAWRRVEVVPGPFATDPNSRALFIPVDPGRKPAWLFSPRGDDDDATMRSSLDLSVDGHAYTKPHADLDSIGRGEPQAYAHWGQDVFFTLPPGVGNDWHTHAALAYPLRLASPWMTVAVLILLAAVWLFIEKPRLERAGTARATRWPHALAIGLAGLAAAMAAVYAAVTAVAWAQGWALPSTAAIRATPEASRLAAAEPHAAELALAVATVGAIAGWAARARRADRSADKARVLRVLRVIGLPVLFAGLVLSASAQWTGMARQGDFSFASIAGLLPFSDSESYYADANDVVNIGLFGPVGARRPLAQAFRSTLMALGGYDYAAMVLVQSLFVALAIVAAAGAVARWRGPWAGLAFAAMAYAVGREFCTTALTEPLGLFWALCAVPPLVRALRDGSSRHAVLAFGLVTVALFNRMGSMFAIPALLVWLVACFGKTRASKLRIGAAAVAVLIGVAGLNAATARVYTRDTGLTGSNFSYVLCGLTIGEAWSVCEDRYKDELPPSDRSEEAMVHLMYRKAFQNFTAHPSVFFLRVADGAFRFSKTLPGILTQGYNPVTQLFPAGLSLFEIVAGVGLLRLLPGLSRRERVFWLLFWSSTILSSGFVYFDDGRRVMIASYPVAALFFASGLRVEETAVPDPARRPLSMARAGTGALAAAALLTICSATPWLVHRFLRPSAYFPPGTPLALWQGRAAGERFVFGGSRLTGVLVVADGEPLRTDVPTLHLSDFVDIVRQSGVEADQPLVTPAPPPVPFGFVESPNLVPGEPTQYEYVVPADVMLRKDVLAWRLSTEPMPQKPGGGSFWLQATGATPVRTGAVASDRASR